MLRTAHKALLCIFITALLSTHAALSATQEHLEATSTQVAETLLLSNKTLVRIAGIMTPKDLPTANMAKKFLDRLIEGKEIETEILGKDRHGIALAQIYIIGKNGAKSWLQEELVKSGLFFVFPTIETEENIYNLLKAEHTARASKNGIWAEKDYRDIPAQLAHDKYGRFSFVSGTVLSVTSYGDKTYLNFGKDWKTDFTVSMNKKMQRRAKKLGMDIDDLKGKTIRIRGIIEEHNGPMIVLHAPEQLELLKQDYSPSSSP